MFVNKIIFEVLAGIKNLIVVGASTGGITAMSRVLSALPKTIDAAVLAVVHMSVSSNAVNLAGFIQKHTSLTCIVPSDKEIIILSGMLDDGTSGS